MAKPKQEGRTMGPSASGVRWAGLAALVLTAVALALTACGGGDSTTAQTSSTATQAAKATKTPHKSAQSSSAARALSGAGGSVGHPARVLTADARRGRRAGKRACTGIAPKVALTHFLAVAKAAQKSKPIPARAGFIARIAQLPKSAYNGKAATAMAAALFATGLPIKQRAGGFAGCMSVLRR